MTQKSSHNEKLELKKLQEIKVIQQHEQSPKQFQNSTPTPKITYWGPKKIKNDPQNSQLELQKVKKRPQNEKRKLNELQKIKVGQQHEQTRQQFVNPTLTPKITHKLRVQRKKKLEFSKRGGGGPKIKKNPTFPKPVPCYLECHDSARNVIKIFWPYVPPPHTTTTNSAAALHRSLCSWKLAYIQQL